MSIYNECLRFVFNEKHADTLQPQILYYIRAFHLLNRCSAIYGVVPVLV